MAKLPSPDDISRSSIRPSTGINTIDLGAEAKADIAGGRQLQQTGNELASLATSMEAMRMREQARMDDLRADDALNKLAEKRTALTIGDTGFTKIKGGDVLARPVIDEYSTQFDAEYANIESGLATAQQKEMFKRKSANLTLQYKADLLRHATAETDKYSSAVAQATVDRYAGVATSPTATDQEIMDAKNGIAEAITKDYVRQGNQAAAPEAVRKTLSNFYTSVILAKTSNKDVAGARKFFDENKDYIDVSKHAAIKSSLKEGDLRYTAQAFGDTIMQENLTREQAYAKARESFVGPENADKRDEAIKEIDRRYLERENASKVIQEQLKDKALNIVVEGGGRKDIPPDLWESLDPVVKSNILETERLRIERAAKAAKGEDVKTDITAYAKLRQTITENPNIKQTDVIAYPEFQRLSNTDQQEIIKLSETVKKDPKKAAKILTVDAMIGEAALGIGLKQDKTTGPKRMLFERKARDAINSLASSKGIDATELPESDVRPILNKLSIEGVVEKDWAFDPSLKLYEVPESEQSRFKAKYNDDDKAQAKAALIKKGVKNPTPKQIQDTIDSVYGLK